jgi:hypothetical protein
VRLALVASVVSVVSACALVGPPAHAETWQARDADHDVSTLSYTSDPEPCGTFTEGSDPTDELRDLTRLRVVHRTDAITLAVAMREVRRRSDNYWSFHLLVPAGAFFIDVFRRPRGHKLMSIFAKEPHFGPADDCGFSYGTSKGRSCDGLTATLDPRRDTLRVEVPRECLKDPRWVQVGVTLDGGFTGGATDFTSHSDEWIPSGGEATGYPPPYGPKVFRG